MKRIDELTPEMRATFPEIIEKYIKLGLNCDEADWENSRRGIDQCYRFAKLDPPKHYVKVQSPLVMALAAPTAAWMLDRLDAVGKIVLDEEVCREAITEALQIFADLGQIDAVAEAVCTVVLPENTMLETSGKLQDPREVFCGRDNTKAMCKYIKETWYKYLGGCFWMSWHAYLEVYRRAGLELPGDTWDREDAYRTAQQSSGWWWPHTDFVMVCNRPRAIRMDNNRLHCDTGAAIEWRDGYAVHALRGCRMTKEQATTPVEDMTRDWIEKHYLNESNAQVRAEITNKMGKDLFVSRMDAKVVDREGEMYELLAFKVRDRERRALKMMNPSVPGLCHIEEVPGACKTVAEALHARKPAEMREIPIDDENGQEWVQQGDVCIWPRGAKSLKSRPSKLT